MYAIEKEDVRSHLTGFSRAGIPAAALEEPLSEEQRFDVLNIVNEGIYSAIWIKHDKSDTLHITMTINGIRSYSSLLLSAARLKDMGAGPAWDCFEGNCSHENHFESTLRNVSWTIPEPTRPIFYDNEGGPA